MPVGVLANALQEFELVLDELTSSLEFVRAAGRLRPRLKDMLSWQLMDAEAKKLATTFLGQRTAEESVLYRGMVVSLSGAFEQFIGRVLRDSILALNGPSVDYDTLDDAVKKQNLYRTGVALKTIYEPPDHLNLDYETLAKNIGTCFIGSKQAVLNAEAFTVFLSVVSPDQLVDALKRIGIQLNWDDLGKVQAMRNICDKRDTRETAKAIQESLKRFGQTRNKIAHTGSSGIMVTETDFEQLVKFFRILARALVPTVEAEIGK